MELNDRIPNGGSVHSKATRRYQSLTYYVCGQALQGSEKDSCKNWIPISKKVGEPQHSLNHTDHIVTIRDNMITIGIVQTFPTGAYQNAL